jgi:predicted RNA-binding Zn-ribbon protein involved in translation (DUF1610 family)
MKKVRLTIKRNPEDPADDLRYAARVRRDLWAHSPVEIDPESPVHGTHRDTSRNAYFEFATNYLADVERVLVDQGHHDRVEIAVKEGEVDPECLNCGISTTTKAELWTVCPNCGFRDISACPYCNEQVARSVYLPFNGDVFTCPKCHRRVRLRFHEPLFDSDGHFIQPIVVVEKLSE